MEKNHTIDFIKFFAMFFIVCIHTGTLTGTNINGLNGDQIDQMINVFARFGVPFFFITSGFLFTMRLHSKGRTFSYFMKYVKKLALLYFSWFLIYAVYDYWKILWETGNYSLSNPEAIAYLESLVTREIFIYGVGNTQYHLWFLPALIWPIVFIFIFYKVKKLNILFFISIFLHLIGMLGQSYSFLMEIPYQTRDPFFFGLFYAVTGSLIAIHYDSAKKIANKINPHVYLVAIVALMLAMLGERVVTVSILGGGKEEYFLATIPLCILLFLLAVRYQHVGEGTTVNKIGRSTVGIFVVHPLVISISNVFLKEMNLTQWKEHLLYGFLFTPIVFFLSYFLYGLIQNSKKSFLAKKEPKAKPKEISPQ